jgi:hypothetical protein
VTDPTDVLLDRVQLERAFTALGDRLVRRGVVADIFVVGGAAEFFPDEEIPQRAAAVLVELFG